MAITQVDLNNCFELTYIFVTSLTAFLWIASDFLVKNELLWFNTERIYSTMEKKKPRQIWSLKSRNVSTTES